MPIMNADPVIIIMMMMMIIIIGSCVTMPAFLKPVRLHFKDVPV